MHRTPLLPFPPGARLRVFPLFWGGAGGHAFVSCSLPAFAEEGEAAAESVLFLFWRGALFFRDARSFVSCSLPAFAEEGAAAAERADATGLHCAALGRQRVGKSGKVRDGRTDGCKGGEGQKGRRREGRRVGGVGRVLIRGNGYVTDM